MTISSVIWLVGAGVAGLATYGFLRLLIRYLRLRTREIRYATEALTEYEAAFDRVMDDPATPKSWKQFLAGVDQVVGSREAARKLAIRIFTGRSNFGRSAATNREADAMFAELDKLAMHRKDLVEDIARLVGAGLLATMLRWPLSARAFSAVIVNTSRDPVTPARALKGDDCPIDDNHHATAPA